MIARWTTRSALGEAGILTRLFKPNFPAVTEDRLPAPLFYVIDTMTTDERQTLGHTNVYNRIPRPAVFPTLAMPGTRAKVAVLMRRARKGEQLWHPADAVDDEPGMPTRMLKVGPRNEEATCKMRRVLQGPRSK